MLIVDDDDDTVRLMRAILARHGFTDVERVHRGADALARGGDFDIVLLDHELPDMTGVEAVGPLRSRPRPPSIVVVTGHGSEALAAQALRRGAEDYLVKDASLPHLLPQVLDRVRRERALRGALSLAQGELLRAERLAAIGEMTVTLHHEINNPLMAASAELELLNRGDDPLTPAQKAGLAALQANLERIRDIVRRIGSLRDTKTAPYPGNLRMIDLTEDTGGAGIELPLRTRGTAILAVDDDHLAQVLTGVLGSVGYAVERSRDAAALERGMRALSVTLVVLTDGGSIPTPPSGHSPKRIVLVRDEAAAAEIDADLIVQLPFDPSALADDIAALGES